MYPWNSMYGASSEFTYLTEFQHQYRFTDDASKRSSCARVQFIYLYLHSHHCETICSTTRLRHFNFINQNEAFIQRFDFKGWGDHHFHKLSWPKDRAKR